MARLCGGMGSEPGRRGALLIIVAMATGLSGCVTVANMALPAQRRRAEGTASVYVSGPVPGWQRGPGPTHASGTGPYFSASFFGGTCPALLNLSKGSDGDPFGPVDHPGPSPLSMGNSLYIHPDYAPFGRVALGGPGPVGYQWEALSLYGMGGGGCGFPGFRLVSVGNDDGPPVLHR